MCDPTEDKRVILTVGIGPESQFPKELHLCFLGCEDTPPYGPTEHTAQLFLNLFESALTQEYPYHSYRIKISVYRCQQMDYPLDYSAFHGILLPGSFSGAYETHLWIERLKQEIATVLFPQSIPTLGICFGHQIYAHALEGGKAAKCPAGPQTGCKFFECTDIGKTFMSNDGSVSQVTLLYTHGDMVESLPSCGLSLGGTDSVPIQAAIYYNESRKCISSIGKHSRTVAVTFQAHPEYAGSALGYDETFLKILQKMDARRVVADRHQGETNASDSLDKAKQHSLKVLIMAGKSLGWFK